MSRVCLDVQLVEKMIAKAKMIKSNIIILGINDVIVGFDTAVANMRVTDFYESSAFPPMMFFLKDLKPVVDSLPFASEIALVDGHRIEVVTGYEKVEEFIMENGEIIPVFPNMEVNTNPYDLAEIYNKYRRIMSIRANVNPVDRMLDINDETIELYKSMRANNRPIIYNLGRHSLVLYYGLINLNKGDTLSMQFYDISDREFLTEYIIYKSKQKSTIKSYTINFVLV